MAQCKAISKCTNKKCTKKASLVGYCITHYNIFEYPKNVEVEEYQGMTEKGTHICDICKMEKTGLFYYFIVRLRNSRSPFCVCFKCVKAHSQYEDKIRESHKVEK